MKNEINDEQIKVLLKKSTKVSTSDHFVDDVMAQIHNIEDEKEKKAIKLNYYLSWGFIACAVILSFFLISLIPDSITIGNVYGFEINSLVIYLPITLVAWLLIDKLIRFRKVKNEIL